MANKKAVISMSGGLDSTCLALHLLSQGYEVRAYAFDYGQKHNIELEVLEENIKFLSITKKLPITLQVINLRDVFSDSCSSLTGKGNIPKGDYNDSNMKSTVVENRNIIFSSIIYGKALSWAKENREHVEITLGIHSGDHSLYPDCSAESQEMARNLFKISNWDSELVDYVAPFVYYTKAKVLHEGLTAMANLDMSEKDVDFILYHTHSCYDPDEFGRSCGLCGTCKERLDAFGKNGVKDPVEYRTRN